MTVIDQVLQAENAAENIITTAKAEALDMVHKARLQQAEALKNESTRLAEAEATALTSHHEEVLKQVESITTDSETEVARITKQIEGASSAITEKIKQAFS